MTEIEKFMEEFRFRVRLEALAEWRDKLARLLETSFDETPRKNGDAKAKPTGSWSGMSRESKLRAASLAERVGLREAERRLGFSRSTIRHWMNGKALGKPGPIPAGVKSAPKAKAAPKKAKKKAVGGAREASTKLVGSKEDFVRDALKLKPEERKRFAEAAGISVARMYKIIQLVTGKGLRAATKEAA